VPFLALTADRPPELRATGANQTIDQSALYGGAVRWAADVGVPEAGREESQNRYWRSLVAKALAIASGALSAAPGPVHLNLPFREPLLPGDDADGLDEPWTGRPDGAPWTAVAPGPAMSAPAPLPDRSRTLVVVGDGPPSSALRAAACADVFGWPMIAEPSSGVWGHRGNLRAGALLLGTADWLAAHRPDRVVVVGRPTLSRPVSALLLDPAVRVETVSAFPRWADAGRTSAQVGRDIAGGVPSAPVDAAWLEAWQRATGRVGVAVDAVLDARPELTAARLARDVVSGLPSGALLVLGSSTPVRDVDRLAVPRHDLTVLANRGVAGIDGTISTAVGAALVHDGPAFALMGDLTFLHDLTGLLVGAGERWPDLTVVVPDNDGGGIFAQLESGEERYAQDYRRVFGTPHGRNLVAVAESLGWAATRISEPGQLGAALALGGPRVVVVGTDQRAEAALAGQLRRAAADALRT
jgi:2-succinyl-5-enolpyruvyl-6-hydroxy-3-cyclohexene-1-carboxylate synthase